MYLFFTGKNFTVTSSIPYLLVYMVTMHRGLHRKCMHVAYHVNITIKYLLNELITRISTANMLFIQWFLYQSQEFDKHTFTNNLPFQYFTM